MQLIIDVQMSSKEQLMGIEQNTLEIAQEVVSSTNTKKFIGV